MAEERKTPETVQPPYNIYQAQGTQPVPYAPTPEMVSPELTAEQKEFLDAMNNLILSAQELSYAVALLPNDLVESHPEIRDLMESAKNVVRAVYRFHKLIKKRGQR